MEFKGTGKKWKNIGNEIWNKDGSPIIIGLAYPHNPNNVSIDEQKANALLISKAPEMLEMLKKCRDYFTAKTDWDSEERADEIWQLIKEATEIN